MSAPKPGHDGNDPVVVVGLSFEFPQGAVSAQAFWEMLCEGRSAMTEIPPDRFNIDAFYHPDAERNDTINGRGVNCLSRDLAFFDAPFFSMTPDEAESLDPQQRQLLETTYRALENAGIPMLRSAGSDTSVYVGGMAREYDAMNQKDPERFGKYSVTGTGSSMLANRLSWFYDFRGASLTLDTACSSGLYALHLACQDLCSGGSSMSLVGASNIILNPETIFVPLSNLQFLSPDSHCHSFSQKANGYARGEGVAILVLKRLSRALADDDTIRAIIRGTHANQDGRTPGITQPSLAAQKELITACYRKASLELGSTRMFEAHGTGTTIGDSVEASAIHEVFKPYRDAQDPLIVGAVKSNIGHLEGASGLAGLVKSILILENGVIPPNFDADPSEISVPAESWGLKFPHKPMLWPGAEDVRRISINSFGFGGANAHVILQDARSYLESVGIDAPHVTRQISPDVPDRIDGLDVNCRASQRMQNGGKDDARLLVFSASDQGGLDRVRAAFQDHLISKLPQSAVSAEYLSHLAHTLALRRTHLSWRSFVVASNVAELVRATEGGFPVPIRSSEHIACAFIFSGQGSLWSGMGRELLHYPVFSGIMYAADEHLRSLGCTWSLIERLLQVEDSPSINDVAVAQPLCTALQVGLVELLKSWNIRPSAVVGHSSGEIAAAYTIGALTKEQALEVAYYRGMHTSKATARGAEGAMLSVAASASVVLTLLSEAAQLCSDDTISIGCFNSPASVTVTGNQVPVLALMTLLSRAKIFYKLLPIDVAYHCSKMQSTADPYGISLSKRAFASVPDEALRPESETKMYSCVTGEEIFPTDLCKSSYWVTNLLSQVRFSDAVARMCAGFKQGGDPTGLTTVGSDLVIIEVGPHASLRRPVTDTCRAFNPETKVLFDSVLRQSESARETALALVGRLHCLGKMVNLSAVNDFALANPLPRTLVDLPGYPFNHERRYWHESRLSSNHRFRRFPRHDFLGTPTPDWNPLEPMWRNIIRVRENPWIADHKLKEVTSKPCPQGGAEPETLLYPFGGMLVMVIEASRQLADASRAVSSFRFRDVRTSKALNVSLDAAGTETELFMRPVQASSTMEAQCFHFRLCLLERDEWQEVFTGSVLIEYVPLETEVDHGRESTLETSAHRTRFGTISSRCKTQTGHDAYYEKIQKFGFTFGPACQTLHEVGYSGDGAVVASVDFSKTYQASSDHALSQHLVHPCSLDSMFQLILAAISDGGTTAVPFMVPTQLGEMWISNKLLHVSVHQRLNTCAEVAVKGFREVEGNFLALDATTGEEFIRGDRYVATALRSLSAPRENSERRQLAHLVEWAPAIETMTSDELQDYMSATGVPGDVQNSPAKELEKYCRTCAIEALRAVSPEDIPDSRPHLRRYYQWLKTYLEPEAPRSLPPSSLEDKDSDSSPSCESPCTEKYDRSFSTIPSWRIFPIVGRNLQGILQGEADALELLFRDDAATDFYTGPMMNTYYESLGALVKLMTFKCPTMNILEIGAGTGGATSIVLSKLLPDTGEGNTAPTFDGYWYTDISPAFFEAAKVRYGSQHGRMHYKVLDVEQDPTCQGFETAQFDLVIASCVIHATTNVGKTLENIGRLLKPGGRVAMVEPTDPDSLPINFCFGLLPGWWLSEEKERQQGPLLTDASWNTKLLQAGFEGVGSPVHHRSKQGEIGFSLFSSTKATPCTDGPNAELTISIIVELESPYQQELGQILRHRLKNQTPHPIACINSNRASEIELEASLIIVLVDCDLTPSSMLQTARWKVLKSLSNPSRHCVWISRTGNASLDGPLADTMTGLTRSLRSENSNCRIRTIILEEASTPFVVASKIAKIATSCLDPSCDVDCEYRISDDLCLTNRIVDAKTLNQYVEKRTASSQLRHENLALHLYRLLALKITSPGLLDSFYFEEEAGLVDTTPTDMVDIDVKAFGLNFKDVLIALGQVPESSFGLECSGRVTKIGRNVRDVKVGDKVCCCSSGVFKTQVRVHKDETCVVPDSLPYTEAAAIALVFSTAYYALYDVGRLQKDESVLIQSGAGGVGQAAVQLAQKIGAEVFVTVGSDSKKRLMMDRYGIPEDHILYSRNGSFVKGIQRLKSNGVDVVLNSLSGELLHASWTCLAPFGRFIEIGKKDILSDTRLSMAPFSKNVTFSSVDLGFISSNAKALLGRVLKDVGVLLWDRPATITAGHPLHVFKPSEIEHAFRFLQSGKNTGKSVVDLSGDSIVSVGVLTPVLKSMTDHIMNRQIRARSHQTWSFSGEATYVIAGGLGGIGRSISTWMAANGAKHLLLLSRSGAKSKGATELRAGLAAMGAVLHTPACDIGDARVLQNVLDQYSVIGPPIKGCVQGAMILKDGLFENMGKEDFEDVVRPKVTGSWNLHKLLPKNLEFFIMLSSAAGITGSRGQANYAAGNTFQDALARFRVSIGQKATAIDLGLVLDVGYAAEREEVTKAIKKSGHEGISEADVLTLMEYWCDPARDLATPDQCQIVTDLVSPASLRRRGLEEPFWMKAPMFRPLYLRDIDTSVSADGRPEGLLDLATSLRSAASQTDVAGLITQALVTKLSKSLAVPAIEIDTKKPIHSFGVDSLVAVEIRYWFLKETNVELRVMDIMRNSSLADLCVRVASRCPYCKSEMNGSAED